MKFNPGILLLSLFTVFLTVSCDNDGNSLFEDLIEPEVRESVNGELNTSFDIIFAPNVITGQDGGQDIFTRSYDGLVPGPTFRVQPGDTMNITINNMLPPNTDQSDCNPFLPHKINSTNFHTHGLHVSPAGNSDNVLLEMLPSTTTELEIAIPANHPGGTHWFHPHKHGSVDIQVTSGMGGTIIVEGAIDQVPEIAAAREFVLVFNELNLNNEGEVEDPDIDTTDIGDVFPSDVTYYTVNAQLNPILRVQPGEVFRLRMVNATIGTFYPLQLDGHVLNLIAHDGIAIDQLKVISNPFDDDSILEPGGRLDVLIRAGDPGEYTLRGLEYVRGGGLVRDEVDLMTVVVEGDPLVMGLPDDLPEPYADVTDGEIVGTRVLVFDTVDNTGQFDDEGYDIDIAFTLDDMLYDEDVVSQVIKLDTAEQWTLINNATEVHNFHIHTNPFQVIERNGEPIDPFWADTTLIDSGGGTVTIRTRYLDFTGELVLHCHILDHEDLGMMQNVVIEE